MTSSWLTKEQVCELTGWAERTLQRKSASGAVESRDSTLIYCGQAAKEYALSSLPAEARAKYLDGKSKPKPAEKPEWRLADSPLSLTPLFAQAGNVATADASLAVQTPVRVALTPAAEQQAVRRIAILRPLLDYIAKPATRGRFHSLALANGERVSSSDSMSRYLAEQHGVSRTTLWAWKRKFEAQGATALARKIRADKNRSAWAAQHRDLADLAALVYMGNNEQPAQSKTVAWEAVCQRAGRMGVAAPSYEAVRTFLSNPNEVSPSMRVLGREGRKKYDAQFAPYMKRGYTEPAYSIVVSDHMIHDALCVNDIFGAKDLKHIRLRMTTLLDYRSRYVVGVSWCEEGSSHSIKRALLRAFTRFGLFDQFYCDNGKDYQKVARGAQRHELEQESQIRVAEASALSTSVMKRLGIPVTFCTPFHPQAKHIERYHRTVHERFDKAFVTYTAGAPHLRPDAATAALARHGKLLQMGRAGDSQLPLASEFIQMCEAWIEQWYHQQPQPKSEGMDGRSPAEVFAAERSPSQRPAPAPELLAMLLCERVTRKVLNCAVEVGGSRFVPDLSDPYANLVMHERSGRSVVIAYDPLDPMYAAVLDEDLQFLCRLQHEGLMRFSHDDETRAKVAGFIGNRNGLRKAVRESTAALNRRVRAAGYVTLEDTMREALQLPVAVGQQIVQRPQQPTPQDSGSSAAHIHSEEIGDSMAARYAGRIAHGAHS